MKINVLGMDPSLRNWGLASGTLDLNTGFLDELYLEVVQPKEESSKQVRKNSKDLELAIQLSKKVEEFASKAKAIFVEVPVGSQSARAMASYGVCVGILGSLQARGFQIIEVSPAEVKRAFTGNKNASKEDMIAKAIELYPTANFPVHAGKIASKAEHVADAIASIHAGVKTPIFKNLMQLFNAAKAN